MAVLLGTLVAFGLGTSDFFGGFASRRSAPAAALRAMQLASLATAVVLVVIDPTPAPSGRLVAWSLVSGVGTLVGLGCLYRALASGRMAVAAPISAVGSGLVPMLWGIARHGERPGAAALVGAALALVAVAVVAEPEAGRRGLRAWLDAGDVMLAAGAGLGFGISIVAFAEAGAEGSFWPVLIARGAGAALVVGVLAARADRGDGRHSRRLARGDRGFAIVAGVLEGASSGALIVALRRGLTSVVAPVAALFPAATVVLARVVLHERIGRTRAAGIGLGLVGLVLMAR